MEGPVEFEDGIIPEGTPKFIIDANLRFHEAKAAGMTHAAALKQFLTENVERRNAQLQKQAQKRELKVYNEYRKVKFATLIKRKALREKVEIMKKATELIAQ